MKYSEKWRETTIDPLKTEFPCGIKIKKILGYPHAANDVFSVIVEKNGEVKDAILKYERHSDANLSKEVKIINQLEKTDFMLPKLISHGKLGDKVYIVTEYVDGERISQLISNLVDEEVTRESLKYMKKFGRNLGRIHSTEIITGKITPRKFSNIMSMELSKKLGLVEVREWLIENNPINHEMCFVHGDHHYANVLWRNYEIVCTLDWELCGFGWKEFDLAWALINRPSQKFMKTKNEIDCFLEGYLEYQSYDMKALSYCTVLIYQYFYEIGLNMKDDEYCNHIKNQFEKIICSSDNTPF